MEQLHVKPIFIKKIAFDKPVQVFIVSELELRYIPHPKLLVKNFQIMM
jgi:hypothetical protein